MNGVERVEPKRGTDLARHARLRPTRDDTANQLGEGRKESDDRDPKHRISGAEHLEGSDGSPVHRARTPGERAREHTSRGGQKCVASRVHHRADDDGET